MRRAYGSLYRGKEFQGRVGARGHHLEDFRRNALLLPPARAVGGGGDRARGQWLRQGRAAAIADGICRRGAEVDLSLVGRFGWMSADDLDPPKLAGHGMPLLEMKICTSRSTPRKY